MYIHALMVVQLRGVKMEEFYIVLNQVIVLFLILLVGVVAGKSGILNTAGTKKLSEVLLYISAPMMIINSFFIEFSSERLINILWVIGTSVLMFFIAILLSSLIFKGFSEKINPVLRFSAIFSNCGYMGLPLIKSLFGDEGVFYGSFYVVILNIFLWSYGYLMFGGAGAKQNVLKKVLTTPAVVALYVGIIIYLSGIGMAVPNAIKSAVSAVGDMTMPLSMLITGGIISTAKFSEVIADWRAYFAASIRLIFMPLLALGIILLAGVPKLPGICVIMSIAMPAATNTSIFSEMFDKDSVLASKCVAISTLLSIITIPLIIYISV